METQLVVTWMPKSVEPKKSGEGGQRLSLSLDPLSYRRKLDAIFSLSFSSVIEFVNELISVRTDFNLLLVLCGIFPRDISQRKEKLKKIETSGSNLGQPAFSS